MDAKELLVKYVKHVAAAEGDAFAVSPLGGGDLPEADGFTAEEWDYLRREVFPRINENIPGK